MDGAFLSNGQIPLLQQVPHEPGLYSLICRACTCQGEPRLLESLVLVFLRALAAGRRSATCHEPALPKACNDGQGI